MSKFREAYAECTQVDQLEATYGHSTDSRGDQLPPPGSYTIKVTDLDCFNYRPEKWPGLAILGEVIHSGDNPEAVGFSVRLPFYMGPSTVQQEVREDSIDTGILKGLVRKMNMIPPEGPEAALQLGELLENTLPGKLLDTVVKLKNNVARLYVNGFVEQEVT